MSDKTRQQLNAEFEALRNDDAIFAETYGEDEFDNWLNDNDIVPMTAYEIRVKQLESEGLTASDAQGVADMETMYGTLQENLDAFLHALYFAL